MFFKALKFFFAESKKEANRKNSHSKGLFIVQLLTSRNSNDPIFSPLDNKFYYKKSYCQLEKKPNFYKK
jgi:hypothetical protein